MYRHSLTRRCFVTAAGLAPLGLALAQSAGSRPIRFIVPFTPGGSTDVMARTIADLIEKSTGRQFIVENKPGGSTVIAAQEVMRSAPDGNTLLFTNAATLTQLPNLRKDLSYDPFKDFSYITEICRVPQPLLCSSELPVTNLRELIAYAKANPGKVSYATVGPGGSGHINLEVFRIKHSLDMIHVPYKGSSDALKDLLPGRVNLILDNAPMYPELIRLGKLRPLAVSGLRRMPSLPDVPTFTEAGTEGLSLTGFFAVYGPARMPDSLLKSLHAEIITAARHDRVKSIMEQNSFSPTYSASPAEFLAEMRIEFGLWGDAIRRSNITL